MAEHKFKELKIWRRSIDLADKVHSLSSHFLFADRFDLVSQARRSAVSVPSNFAEGFWRGSDKDFARFPAISLPS
jgi:four helix bundle protein